MEGRTQLLAADSLAPPEPARDKLLADLGHRDGSPSNFCCQPGDLSKFRRTKYARWGVVTRILEFHIVSKHPRTARLRWDDRGLKWEPERILHPNMDQPALRNQTIVKHVAEQMGTS